MSRSVLLTGAAGNMGKAVLQRLLEDDHTLYVPLAPSDEWPSLDPKSTAPIRTTRLDLTQEEAVATYVSQLIAEDPALDAAVLCVGGWKPGNIANTVARDIYQMIELNFLTAFHLVRPLLSHFQHTGRGQFILIGARPALVPAEAKKNIAYALSKSLLFRLSEVIAEEGKGYAISSTLIVPSTLDTPSNRASMPDADPSRWVQPADIAQTIAFLLSSTGEQMRDSVIKIYHRS